MAKTLYMETTEVPPERTAGDICQCLIAAGATQISTSYEGGKVTGLRWIFRINGIDALFEMPARIEPVYSIFYKRKGYSKGRNDQGAPYWPDLLLKAERVAWRQLFRWVQAQVALIDTGMVDRSEPFVAYIVDPSSGRTIFQHLTETRFKALPPATQ